MELHIAQISREAVEQQRDVYTVFVDFTKAFDTVDRPMLGSEAEALWMSGHLC